MYLSKPKRFLRSRQIPFGRLRNEVNANISPKEEKHSSACCGLHTWINLTINLNKRKYHSSQRYDVRFFYYGIGGDS